METSGPVQEKLLEGMRETNCKALETEDHGKMDTKLAYTKLRLGDQNRQCVLSPGTQGEPEILRRW